MYSSSDWRKAVTKLMDLSAGGQVQWKQSSIFEVSEGRKIIGSYEAEFADKLFVISEVQFKQYFDEDVWDWGVKYDLSVYEHDLITGYERIATAPDVSILSSLYNSAENALAYSRNALGGLL